MSTMPPPDYQFMTPKPRPRQQSAPGISQYFMEILNRRNSRGAQQPPPHPDSTYMSQYAQHAQQMPTYETPSWKRRLLTGLVGGAVAIRQGPQAGFQTQRDILEAPYARSMDQWGAKGNQLAKLAMIEDKMNDNKYQLWNAQTQAALKGDREEQDEIEFIAGLMEKDRKHIYDENVEEFNRYIEEKREKRLRETATEENEDRNANLSLGYSRLKLETDKFNAEKQKEVNIGVNEMSQAFGMAANDIITQAPVYSKFLKRDDDGIVVGVVDPAEFADNTKEINQFRIFMSELRKRQKGYASAKQTYQSGNVPQPRVR